jgi:hypothetical protein
MTSIALVSVKRSGDVFLLTVLARLIFLKGRISFIFVVQ